MGVTGSEEIFNPYGASELTMHFGQFVDHDLAHVPTEEGKYDILLLVNSLLLSSLSMILYSIVLAGKNQMATKV